MKLFFEYMIEHLKSVVFFVLFTLVFAVISAIYELNTEAVLYAFIICGVIGLVGIIADYSRFCRKQKLLSTIYVNLPLMTEELPKPTNLTQRQMTEIISRLHEINSENISRLRSIQRDNSEYFTVWVHQIKTPISAMQMILQSEDSELSRELSAELFKVEQYAEMALQYIRLDSETNDFVIRRYDIDTIIRQAIRRYAALFIRRRIKLDYQSVSAEVLTDEKWLIFVIEQLLSNAVKYTFSGSVKVEFSDGKLTVKDTGIGISSEDLPRIFEKGYTGLSGRTDKKSTGLGLYLCRKICDKLGHGIEVKSEVGVGTEFTVDLTTQKIEIE